MQGTASEDGDGRAGNDWASLEACRCSGSVWYFAYLCPGGREAGRGYGVYDAGNWYFKYVGNDVPQMMNHIVSWINLVKNYIIHTIGNMRMVSAIRMVEMQGSFNYRIRPPSSQSQPATVWTSRWPEGRVLWCFQYRRSMEPSCGQWWYSWYYWGGWFSSAFQSNPLYPALDILS